MASIPVKSLATLRTLSSRPRLDDLQDANAAAQETGLPPNVLRDRRGALEPNEPSPMQAPIAARRQAFAG